MNIEWATVLIGFALFQLTAAVFGAYVAEEKNRSSLLWFLLCLAFGLVALIAVAGVPALGPQERRVRTAEPTAWNPLAGPPPAHGESSR